MEAKAVARRTPSLEACDLGLGAGKVQGVNAIAATSRMWIA